MKPGSNLQPCPISRTVHGEGRVGHCWIRMVEVPFPSPTQSHDTYLCPLHGKLRFDVRQNKTMIKSILKPLKFNLDQLSCFLSKLYGWETCQIRCQNFLYCQFCWSPKGGVWTCYPFFVASSRVTTPLTWIENTSDQLHFKELGSQQKYDRSITKDKL